MGFSGKLKTKIKEGYFKEMLHEIRWMLKYFRRYRFAVLIHFWAWQAPQCRFCRALL